ncbi:MAG: tRNA lysidine(34) synthetase TilS [Nevskiaceae bacterium]|nr:MAG: tRNA lysidine(34) synthetase TilS [Nevskiaceae bacterium]
MDAAFAIPELPALRKGARIWLAYSGGLDSTVLLHRLHEAGVPGLRAVHVHHGLQADADAWARHCRAQCRALGVPFTLLRVAIQARHPAGPEAAAREARYAALRERLRSGDLLVTAHHRRDQAETVLLRLLRGSGVEGLAAMRPLKALPPGQLWRPLLEVSRMQLRAEAERRGLYWIEDPHNRAPRYARSFLRESVWPLLEMRWPQAEASLARAAGHCAEAAQLLAEVATQDLALLGDGETLGVAALKSLPPARRRNALRHWLAQRGYEAPPTAAWDRLEREVLDAREDARPLLRLGDCEFRRYRDRLYLMAPLPPAPGALELTWDGRATLRLPAGCGTLRATGRRARPVELRVRFPQGGETLRPEGGTRTRTLKNLFQEAGVPPWQRLRTPLIYREGALVSVADRWRAAGEDTENLRFTWTVA